MTKIRHSLNIRPLLKWELLITIIVLIICAIVIVVTKAYNDVENLLTQLGIILGLCGLAILFTAINDFFHPNSYIDVDTDDKPNNSSNVN